MKGGPAGLWKQVEEEARALVKIAGGKGGVRRTGEALGHLGRISQVLELIEVKVRAEEGE